MAVTNNELKTRTYVAGSDLSSHQYNIMQDNGGSLVVASEAVNYGICGVLANRPAAANRHASVVDGGKYKVRAGAAINSTQSMLTCNGSGRAIVAGSGDMIIGYAQETASNDGDIISVELVTPFRMSGSPTR